MIFLDSVILDICSGDSYIRTIMTLRYYDVLEETLHLVDEWRDSDIITKHDVLDSVRERILMLMTHVISTPIIGTAYAYPGDVQSLDLWLSDDINIDET